MKPETDINAHSSRLYSLFFFPLPRLWFPSLPILFPASQVHSLLFNTLLLVFFLIHLAKMLTTSTLLTLLSVGATIAAPIRRTFTNLDAAATAEAQVRDNTATRAFSATTIKVSSLLLPAQLSISNNLDVDVDWTLPLS